MDVWRALIGVAVSFAGSPGETGRTFSSLRGRSRTHRRVLRLVINADDLGLHPAIDEGILRARREGVLTSTTVLATGRTAEDAIPAAQEAGLGVGVHLCLTTRLPPAADPSRVPTVAPGGRFRQSWPHVAVALVRRELSLSEVEEELNAQIDRAIAFGANVDHLDGHQHLHALPGLGDIVRKISRERSLPLRKPISRPHRHWVRAPGPMLKATLLGALSLWTLRGTRCLDGNGTFEAGRLDEKTLLGLLGSLPDGDHEIGCHPGTSPGVVDEDPNWQFGWEEEVRALTSPRVRELLDRRGVKLANYGEVFA